MLRLLKNIFKKYYELITYAFFGVLTTIVNIIIYKLTINMMHINPLVANVIAWFFSVAFAFVTNKIFVFKSPYSNVKILLAEALNFFSFRFLSLLMEEGIMLVGIMFIPVSNLIIKIFAQIIVIIANYIFSKFIFQRNNKTLVKENK